MQSTDWPSEHSDALREYHVKRMSYSEIAQALNANFNTRYSRNAVLGKAKRLGLGRGDEPGVSSQSQSMERSGSKPDGAVPYLGKPGERHASGLILLAPKFEAVKPMKLRCVAIAPRHLALIYLEPGDCRYPYGGDEDGEAVTYCGHPRRKDSSYCGAHFRLTRGRGSAAERTATAVLLTWWRRHEARTKIGLPRRDPHHDCYSKLAME